MMPTDLKAQLFDLSDFDRECLARIRERLDLPSNALCVRYALRALDRRLTEDPPKTMVEAALLLGGKEAKMENDNSLTKAGFSNGNDQDGNALRQRM
jgi:hypothetical protein